MGQGQSGPQGERGPKGDLGPPGPQGPAGTNASEDPQQVASLLTNNQGFIAKLGPVVAQSNNLGATVADGVANNVIPRNLITNALISSDIFQKKLIDNMASDTRFRGQQGPPGSAFDDLSIQSALQPKSMWCADGQMCRIPTSAPGTYLTGDTVIQRSKNLYFGGMTSSSSGSFVMDNKHGIVVKDSNPNDGPFLYGAVGGQLGTFAQVNSTSGNPSLIWDSNNVITGNNLKVRGTEFSLGFENLAQGDSSKSRALVKDTGNVLKINMENDFIGGTVIDSNLAIPNTKKFKIGSWEIFEDNGDLKFSKDGVLKQQMTKEGDLQVSNWLKMPNNWVIHTDDNKLKFWNEIDKMNVFKTGDVEVGNSLKMPNNWTIHTDTDRLKFWNGNDKMNVVKTGDVEIGNWLKMPSEWILYTDNDKLKFYKGAPGKGQDIVHFFNEGSVNSIKGKIV
jgi:hypothetical protein